MASRRARRRLAIGVALLAAGALLAGCAAGPGLGDSGIVVGTAAPLLSLDPAAARSAGADLVIPQLYPTLLAIAPGTAGDIVPDAAASAHFTADGRYAVTLRDGLVFANGDRLEASDVVFSIRRQLRIKQPGGPSPLLAGVTGVSATGRLDIEFQLATPGDPRFPELLTSPAGAIVDEEVFSPTAITPDSRIVVGRPFAGPYTIQSLNPGDLLTFTADPGYRGALGRPRNRDVTLKLYSDAANLATDVGDGAIDVAFGGLGPQQLRSLDGDDAVRVVAASGGAVRFLTFDQDTMPFGSRAPDADPERALAVREAVADLVDRSALASSIWGGGYAPLYGFIPDAFPGATPVLRGVYGDQAGRASMFAARTLLNGFDIDLPIPLTVTICPELDGPRTGQESQALELQLEAGGLFSVKIKTVSAAELEKDRAAGEDPVRLASWSPDGADPATFRAPFGAMTGGEQLQARLAAELPVVPLLQERQLAVLAGGADGVRFDGSLQLRFGPLVRR